MNNQQTPKYPQQPPTRWITLFVVIMILLSVIMFRIIPEPADRIVEISYSEFKVLVQERKVHEVLIRGSIIEAKLESALAVGVRGEVTRRIRSRIPTMGDESLLESLEAKNVNVWSGAAAEEGVFGKFLIGLLPWLIFLGVFLWIMQRTARNMGGRFGSGGDLKSFLSGTATQAEIPDVNFSDVAGHENAKREVTELVEYLKNPQKFLKLGAEIPKGVLLMGPPGTGKTLLARALAGEAGVKFFSISGSEFIEVFVGVGASRARHLFEEAKKNSPSIIFIDELDSVGRTRGTGFGGGHDEREQTLNQILAEMDGFTGREAVLVLAATNRPDVLDPALLRPGRFDRHVMLDLPDRQDRVAILKVHAKKTPLAADVDLHKVASGTPGFSGADLKNLVNEAAILAARHDEKQVSMQDFDEAREKVIMGTERSLVFEPEEKYRLAVHEAGHVLLAHFLPHADTLYKVSIIPRGQALGATEQLPEHERHTLPEEYLKDRLAVMLGGRTAEKELLGSLSSGADNDIQQATTMARAMVSRWGMSESVGPVDFRESEEHPFLGREIAQPHRYSEHSAEIVDEAVHKLLLEAENKACDTIRHHRDKLEHLVKALEEKESLYKAEIEKYLGPSEKNKNSLTIVSG